MVRSTDWGSKLVVFCATTKAANSEVNKIEASMVAVAMGEVGEKMKLSWNIVDVR